MSESYLTITPLGGLGEIGLNCQKWETGRGVALVDCGLMFPDDYLWGVDVVIPRFESLFADTERTLDIVLTHGHEDHIGALPWLLIQCKSLRVRLYGSPFTLALAEHKLAEHNLLERAELITVNARDSVTLGDLTFHFIPVCHSIPQGYALAVETPVGRIIHTGDFKLDTVPLGDPCSLCDDFASFAGREGVRLLLADSTNVEIEGHSRPEREVRDTLRDIFAEAEGRIVITLFSSHIDRVRSVLELAREFDRAVLVSGRSLATNIEKAVALGLLERPDNLHTDYAGLPSLPPEKTVILATGTQGEPMSALTRIANGEHKQLSLRSGDTVIMSSRVIPGNARAVSKVINQMYRQGAKVYHDARRTIHATGHACRDELRAVLDTVQPEYFVPVHGEYRHLALHARLAEECGVQSDNILILEDGQPITLTADGCRRDPSVPVESVLVDGKGGGDVGRLVLKERRILGGEGLVVVVLVIAEETGEVLHGPEMISRGFVFEQQYSHLLEDAKCLVLDHLETMSPYDLPKLQDRIRSSLRRFFRDVLDRDPIVVPIVTAV